MNNFVDMLSVLNITPTDTQLKQLEIYADYLIEYNEHTNLTSITNKDEIYLKHFYDSLTITKAIDLNSINNLIDIGTGAGFPGMVLKIMYPHLNVTLLDSNNKKTTFLSNLVNKLGLININIINERSEDYAKNNLDKYVLVTARAVTHLKALSELCLPLTKVNGYFIPLKGNAKEEIEISKNIITKLNGHIEDIIEFNLPIEESSRTLIKIIKTGNTPKGYPRSYSIIKKELKKDLK